MAPVGGNGLGGGPYVKSNCVIYFLICMLDFKQTWQESSLGPEGFNSQFIWYMCSPMGARERAPKGQNHANSWQ